MCVVCLFVKCESSSLQLLPRLHTCCCQDRRSLRCCALLAAAPLCQYGMPSMAG